VVYVYICVDCGFRVTQEDDIKYSNEVLKLPRSKRKMKKMKMKMTGMVVNGSHMLRIMLRKLMAMMLKPLVLMEIVRLQNIKILMKGNMKKCHACKVATT